MKKIALLSDTHSHLPKKIFKYLEDVDEIWHAGDVGNVGILDTLEKYTPLRGVHGNIDSTEVRARLPEIANFESDQARISMLHIAGQPKNIKPQAQEIIEQQKPDIFICGHSHILKIQYLKNYQTLWINPGACGLQGFHKVKTIVLFSIDNGRAKDMNVVEWKR